MMKLEEFADAVLMAVRERANGAFSVWIAMDVKNNGIKLTGIAAVSEDGRAKLCVYLDDYYGKYRDGRMEAGEAAEEVYLRIMEHRNDLADVRAEDFMKWDAISRHIRAKLVNADRNRAALGLIPHRLFLDMAVVYYIKVENIAGDGRAASILIRSSYMEMWGQDEESLYRMAADNMHLDAGPLFMDIREVLHDVLKEYEDGLCTINMYLLTNRDKVFGATEILDKETLRCIGEKLADDFIVLPSSIHETIIIPAGEAPSCPELADMVREINITQVDPQERLSDHVYLYERENAVLRIAA